MKIRVPMVFAFALVVAGFAPGSAILPAVSAAQPVPAADPNQEWRSNLAQWRAQRERDLATPDGWLTLVGLEWLQPGVNSVGAAADNRIRIHAQAPDHIGLLTAAGQTVQILAPNSGFPPGLTINGKPPREGPLAVDDVEPSVIAWHGLSMVVLHRGDRFALRIKDANAPTRTSFHGLNWYPPNLHLVVEARWIPFTPRHIEKIPTVIGTTINLPAPGVARFTLNGQTLNLEPVLEDSAGKVLFFILRDQTSKTTTYEAARFLHTPLPDNGLEKPGTLYLDFNRLENPPCAYTAFATCPLPPEQNRLPVAIEAGEKRFAQ